MTRMKALLEIMARLRDPEGGCPWDLEQDFSTISPHTIEEAYEVDEAIASGDLESLRDELGDLLFQVVFQSRIAEERGLFDFDGVVEAITEKLIRRHPHVFADAATPESVDAQTANWESIKAEERALADRERGGSPDPFAGIPRNLPALARSAKLAGRFARIDSGAHAALAGGDPPVEPSELLPRLQAAVDALAPVQDAIARGAGADEIDRTQAIGLVGRGLRTWVWMARALGVDPEQALRQVDDEVVAAVRDHPDGSESPAAPRGAADRHQAGKSGGR